MSDETFARRLRALEDHDPPDPAFVDRLYLELSDELGFVHRTSTRTAPARPVPRPRPRRRSWPLLAVAALLVLGVGAFVASGGIKGPDDLLTRMLAGERMRTAISREHPQVVVTGGLLDGFDVELVHGLASRLGVAPELVPYAPRSGPPGDPLDLAMTAGMAAAWWEDGWTLVEPVYHWSRWLLVRTDAPFNEPTGLSGERIGLTATAEALPLPEGAVRVSVGNDLECLGHLEAGRIAACITTTLGPSDIVARPTVRILGEPLAIEPRGPMIRRSSDATSFEVELRAALDSMRSDGTIADLSRRYLGTDLTLPPKDS
jgi:ABC-type amino acid transport substrate-binding protein